MDENEYKASYQEIAKNRCVFEKALTNNQCKCRFSQHFWLADREGYACKSHEISINCRDILKKLRENARFSLKLPAVAEKLPHNMDLRVQVGGLRGLRAVLGADEKAALVIDIRALVEQAVQQYENMDALPYNEIVQSIASFQLRKRSKRKQNSNTD